MRVGVIGVGHLGRHHARLLAAMDGVTLAGVVDVDRDRAEAVAAEFGTMAFTDWAQLSDVEAVTIAAPTDVHVTLALPFIERGVHVLIEKPMAQTVADADRVVEAARRRAVVAAIGHTERFNPAVQVARPLVTAPRFVEVHRLGTFPERSLDIDVVFDLMIHDLDLVLDMVGPDVETIEAVGVPVLTPRVDIANARLRFAGGCVVNLTASRISRDRVRKFRFFQPDAYLSIDYASKEIESWRLVREDTGKPVIEGGKLDVPRQEPLACELADFVTAIRDRRAPRVPAEQGRAALALATRIVDRMEESR